MYTVMFDQTLSPCAMLANNYIKIPAVVNNILVTKSPKNCLLLNICHNVQNYHYGWVWQALI